MANRRDFLLMSSLATAGALLPQKLSATPQRRFDRLSEGLSKLEKECGGRLGVAVLDATSNEKGGYRADERFAMCSTFKMLLAAAVLKRVDAGSENLTREIAIPATGLLVNSPITKEAAGKNLPVRDLCGAIITRSDNTAANLLLGTIGGPAGLTRFARSIGDTVTRLDRYEIELNEARPGDPRDTTSPASMVANWRRLLLGNELTPASRKLLLDWLIANTTGDDRLRAGLGHGWRVGDKTGSNGGTTTNDVAIVWPSSESPVLIAAYLTECPGPEAKRNAVLASVGGLVAAAITAS